MADKPVIGIDLGTTFSSVAYINPETKQPELIDIGDSFDEYVPSMIFFKDGDFLIGSEAYRQRAFASEGSLARLFKRKMGTSDIVLRENSIALTATDCSAKLLEYLKQGAEAFFENHHGATEISDVVITTPANFNEHKRLATIDAAQQAGLKLIQTINEPTAALLALAKRNPQLLELELHGYVMVFDFGGGTLDVSIIEKGRKGGPKLKVVTSQGRDRGGLDIDDLIFDELVQAYQKVDPQFQIEARPKAKTDLLDLAIDIKERLSVEPVYPVQWSHDGKTMDFPFSRRQLKDLIQQDVLDEIFATAASALNRKNLRYPDLDKVVLIGGSSLLPFVKEHFAEQVGAENVIFDEQNCRNLVAYGAALITEESLKETGALVRDDEEPTLIDDEEPTLIDDEPPIIEVAPYSLGIVAYDEERGRLINSVILPQDTPLPTDGNFQKVYQTIRDNQTEATLLVLQGENRNPERNSLIEHVRFEGITPRPAGKSSITVTIDYDPTNLIAVIEAEEVGRPEITIREEILAKGSNENLRSILDEMRRDVESAAAGTTELDVVFMFDTTGSMNPYIEQVKAHLSRMVGELVEFIPDLRLAIIGYGDHDQDQKEPYVVYPIDFSQDKEKLASDIQKMEQTYGGDTPEAIADALHAATELSWIPSNNKAIILVGDAPPHGEYRGQDAYPNCPNGFDWKAEFKRLSDDMDVTFYTILCGSDPDAERVWRQIAEPNDGRFVEFGALEPEKIVVLLQGASAKRAGKLDEFKGTIPVEDRKLIEQTIE
jgi:molecular chaperone DnaK